MQVQQLLLFTEWFRKPNGQQRDHCIRYVQYALPQV